MNLYDLVKDGKIKRYLRSRNKLNYPGLISHITQHASGRDPLFVEDGDYLYLIKLLKEITEDLGISVFAFCFMTNHVHLLLKQFEKNLPEAMSKLFFRYAVYFNRKYSRKGHLFSGNFRQAACFNDYYLLAASVYLHLNPVRAGMVRDCSQYRWSTWKLYCQEIEADTFVDWKFILGMVDRNYSSAKRKYREMLEIASGYRAKEASEVKMAIGKFSVWFRSIAPKLTMAQSEVYPKELRPAGYSDDRSVNEEIERLRMKKRLTQPGDFKARRFAIEQLKNRGFTVQEIADILGVSRATVYLYR